MVEHSCKIKTEIKTTVVNCNSKQTKPNAKPFHSSEFQNLGDSAPENLSLRLAFLVLKEKVLKTHLHLTSLRDPHQSLANPWRRQPQSESLSLLCFLCYKLTCAWLKKKEMPSGVTSLMVTGAAFVPLRSLSEWLNTRVVCPEKSALKSKP